MTRKHPLGLWALAAVCAFMALQSHAQTYNRFGPANGVLVGNTSTPQTTAANSSNIISLWSGTCNASSFLRGDGSCAAAGGGGAGTVTSVGLTVPSGLSVTGSPITTSGTLAINTTLNGLLRGTGSGFATAASSNVISLWTGTCDSTTYLRGDGSCVTPGGGGGGGTVTSVGLSMPAGFSVTSSPVTGSGTLTVSTTLNGPLAGNGSGFTTANSSGIIGLWSGTCNASSFLRGDGSCATLPVPSAANPTATIGLTANNGVATTFMRSDATPALSQAIAPTWTNQHNFATTTRIGPAPVATVLTGAGRLQMVGTSAVIPSVTWTNNGGTTNLKSWDLAAFDSGTFIGRSFNDAADAAYTWLSVDKVTGSHVVDVINLQANSVQVGGTDVRNAGGLFTSGTLPVMRGGTGTTTSTGTGNVVLSNSPTFTGTVSAATVAASAVTVGGQNVCQQNGTNCPSGSGLSAYGVIVVSGGTCSVGTQAHAGISSCSYVGAGIYNVVFSASSATTRTCVVSEYASNPPRASMTTSHVNSTTVAVRAAVMTNASPITWTVSDIGAFSLMCMAN